MALMYIRITTLAVVFLHAAVTLLFLSYCVEYQPKLFFAEHDDVMMSF